MKVAVVGGGPAGVATLKFLATAHLFFPIPPIDVRLFEAEPEIGGTFTQRVYEDAEVCQPPPSLFPPSTPSLPLTQTFANSSCLPST